MLLEYGADVNARENEYGVTPLMRACAAGNLETVKLLLIYGAEVDIGDKDDGKTAIDYAKEAGRDDIVQALQRRK